MVIQAAVIEIYRADNGLAVVADKDLRMDKAGGIFVYPDSGLQQRGIVRLGQRVGDGLVRYAGEDELNVNSALCREAKRRFELAVENEVRRHNVHIALRAVENIRIHHLADAVAVQRAVPVGDDPAGGRGLRLGIRHCEIFLILGLVRPHIPHLEKQQREAVYRAAAEHYGRVFPVPVGRADVYVPVRKIYAARESDLAVDDEDLPVVAEIIMS